MEPSTDPQLEKLSSLIHEYHLTPDELAGEPYKAWWFLYVYLGACLFGIAVVVFCLVDALVSEKLAVLLFIPWIGAIMGYPAFINGREALAEHLLMLWCRKQDVTPLEWLRRRDELVAKVPHRLLWTCKHLPNARRPTMYQTPADNF